MYKQYLDEKKGVLRSCPSRHVMIIHPSICAFINVCSDLSYKKQYTYTVLSVNEYTPLEKYNFKQYLNEHKNHFQNVDKTKFNITFV